ncbi:MAG: methyltransferase domain-containing protein [Hyphomicrobiaceae bacterium]|nr:methyltransferase domain-containing protein [Hyphomicrobiaceae bacterium]
MGRKLDEPAVADAYNLALELEESGDIEGAVAALKAYLELDPQDHGGAAVRLAALERGAVPAKAPDSYVEVLFDQHADAFEDILVEQLGYDVPNLVRKKLDALGLGPFERVLDLGCGTGLAAEALRDRVTDMIGIDISSRMIDICEDKDIYEGLYCGEVEEFLADNDEEQFDLITACDVLPYLGELDPLFEGAADNLVPGGLLVFSSETLGDMGGRPFRVAPHQRFVHAADYVQACLADAGFEIVAMDDINVRMQDGRPTPGHLVVARLG